MLNEDIIAPVEKGRLPRHLRPGRNLTRAMKKKHVSFKVKLWLGQDGGRCGYCARWCQWWTFLMGVRVPDDAWTLEHVIPLSRGGSRLFSNTLGVCSLCNLRQDKKLRAIEWLDSQCGGLMEPKDTIWELDRKPEKLHLK